LQSAAAVDHAPKHINVGQVAEHTPQAMPALRCNPFHRAAAAANPLPLVPLP
jgi:hypothetical protein